MIVGDPTGPFCLVFKTVNKEIKRAEPLGVDGARQNSVELYNQYPNILEL